MGVSFLRPPKWWVVLVGSLQIPHKMGEPPRKQDEAVCVARRRKFFASPQPRPAWLGRFGIAAREARQLSFRLDGRKPAPPSVSPLLH